MELFRRRTKGDVHPADWSQAPRATKFLAAIASLIICAGVGLIFLAGAALEMQGPVRIASDPASEILIGAYDRLFLVDADGALHRFRSTALGLTGAVDSVHVEDGDWLLGDDGSGLLYRCSADLARCRVRFAKHQSTRMFSRSHGVAFLGDKLVVADAERHRLRVFDKTGLEVLTTRTSPVELCYPNEVLAVDGLLYVADTNNFRIARIDPTQNYRSETFIQTSQGPALRHANCSDVSSQLAQRGDAYVNRVLDTATTVGRRAQSPARERRVFPVSLLHSSHGDWWVVQMNENMAHGDVILYGSDGRALKRVALPDDSDPTDMLETGDGVLITDPTLSRIYEVTLDGTFEGDWGSAELEAQWQAILKDRAHYRAYQPIGWGVICLGLILGAIVVVRELMRVKGNWNPYAVALGPVDVQPAVLNAYEVWLTVQPKFAKQLKLGAWVSVGVGVLFCVLTAWACTNMFAVHPFKNQVAAHRFVLLFGWTAFITMVLMLWSAAALYRRASMRIGTNGRQVLLDLGNGSVKGCDFDQVLVSNRVLLVGKHMVAVFDKRRRAIFPLESLQSVVLARIPPANFVKPLRFAIESLRRGNVASWGAVVGVVLFAALQLFPLLFPAQAAALKKLSIAWFGGQWPSS